MTPCTITMNSSVVDDINRLSLNGGSSHGGNSAVVTPPSFGENGDTSISKIIDKPNLNILNQASNVSNLDPTNTSFDPTQVVDVVQQSVVGGTVNNIVELSSQLQPQAQPPQAMIPSFLMQPSPQASSSLQIQAPAATAVVFQQQPNNIIQQQQIVAPQSVIAAGDTALFQQSSNGVSSNAKAVVNSVSTATASVGGATLQQQSMQNQQQEQAVDMQAHAIINQQQRLAVQQMQQTQQQQQIQPIYQQEKQQLLHNTSNNINNASSMNGRVPATRRDGRKLFVGGLPNEVSDLSFLQYFQQYGEVIDSVVLLDRRTKRSRGFGFVTFADPNVAAALLTVIPGRTGIVNILGKNCEIKASEPKTHAEDVRYEAYMDAMNNNMRPHHHAYHNHHHHPQMSHQQQQQQYNGSSNNQMSQSQRVVFGNPSGGGSAGGATTTGNYVSATTTTNNTNQHPLQVKQTMPIPPNFNNNGGGGGVDSSQSSSNQGVPIYSHSTITRTTAAPTVSSDGTTHEGISNVYIQNNFYTLPPGTDAAALKKNGGPTPEALQAQQTELVQTGGTMALGQAVAGTTIAPTYVSSSLQPTHPGSELDNRGQQLQQHTHLHLQHQLNRVRQIRHTNGER